MVEAPQDGNKTQRRNTRDDDELLYNCSDQENCEIYKTFSRDIFLPLSHPLGKKKSATALSLSCLLSLAGKWPKILP